MCVLNKVIICLYIFVSNLFQTMSLEANLFCGFIISTYQTLLNPDWRFILLMVIPLNNVYIPRRCDGAVVAGRAAAVSLSNAVWRVDDKLAELSEGKNYHNRINSHPQRELRIVIKTGRFAFISSFGLIVYRVSLCLYRQKCVFYGYACRNYLCKITETD